MKSNLGHTYALPLRLDVWNIAYPTEGTRDLFDSINLSNLPSNHEPIQAELVQNRLQQDIKMARITEEKAKLDSLEEAMNQQKKYSMKIDSEKAG